MATRLLGKREINLRLIHNGVQPGEPSKESMRFGLQDSKGDVHPGVPREGKALSFDFTVEVKEGSETAPPVFRGTFAHGAAADRFVYLSWKREGTHEHPWVWRIKILLSGIGWGEIRAVEQLERRLVADVIGRRPHSSEMIDWRVETLR